MGTAANSKKTYNPKWYKNKERKEHCLRIARSGEALFAKLTSAEKTSTEEDKAHKDFIWNGKAVDVKGLKPMHLDGYILVEMQNTWGYHGWAAKQSKAEIIAFQMEDHFIIVDKSDLRDLTISLCEPYGVDAVRRENFVKPEDGLYKWIGRMYKKDIFTYLKISDLDNINKEILSFV